MWKSACIYFVYFVFVKYMSFYTLTRIVWKAIHKTLVIISEQWDEGGRNFLFSFFTIFALYVAGNFFSGMSGDCQSSLGRCGSPTAAKSVTFVFGKPIPSSTELPWIQDPRPPQTSSHSKILLSSGDPPTALVCTSAGSTEEISQWLSPVTSAFTKDNAG